MRLLESKHRLLLRCVVLDTTASRVGWYREEPVAGDGFVLGFSMTGE